MTPMRAEAIAGAADRHPHRRRLRHLGGDGRGALGPVPKVRGEPRLDDASDAQPSPRRLQRRASPITSAVSHQVTGIDVTEHTPDELVSAARESWDRAVQLGDEHGYRNAQATVLAPTGTIGLLDGLRHDRCRA